MSECDNLAGKSAAILAACSCKNQVDTLVRDIESRNQKYIACDAKHAEYNRLWGDMPSHRQNWNWRRGQHENHLIQEGKEWNNCVIWDVATGGHGKKDEWCRGEVGAGWYHSHGAGGPCSRGWGRGVCKRTNEQIAAEMRQWEASNPPPADPVGGTNGTPTPCYPTDTLNINTVCCSNSISDIKAKNVQTVNIQNCSINNVKEAVAQDKAEEQARIAEAERIAREELDRLERERIARVEADRIAAVKAKEEADRIAAVKAKEDADKIAAENERIATERRRVQAERVAAQAEADRIERARLAAINQLQEDRLYKSQLAIQKRQQRLQDEQTKKILLIAGLIFLLLVIGVIAYLLISE